MNREPESDGQQAAPTATPQSEPANLASVRTQQQATPASGGRQAFRDIRRQLSDDDLATPGVQKLLLDELERAEAQCEMLSGYIERYYDAEKRAAVLAEKLRPRSALEIAIAVGIGVGGTIVGLSPLFWKDQPRGWLALALGLILMIGAGVAGAVRR